MIFRTPTHFSNWPSHSFLGADFVVHHLFITADLYQLYFIIQESSLNRGHRRTIEQTLPIFLPFRTPTVQIDHHNYFIFDHTRPLHHCGFVPIVFYNTRVEFESWFSSFIIAQSNKVCQFFAENRSGFDFGLER
ncbi:unnamed protein product [Caenorhabditis angaria]|uniref:Uncharacterized protein n=1 Tax=Caenorhabditis angaria TaxID=860376 RepID=A0A9P1IZL2_9PELO|nr:unnamed protein product [Caenorhabditis angaria]